MSSRLVVAAAVLDSLDHPERLLCAARAYPPGLAGRFELPGGKVEVTETPVEALARELAEEISLEVTLGGEVVPPPRLSVPAPAANACSCRADDAPAWRINDDLRMRVWLAEVADGAAPPRAGRDHRALRWEPWDAVGALTWLDADRAVVTAVRAAAVGTR